MGMTTGVAALFVSRDLLRSSPAVCVTASAVGIVLGVLLELANARLAAANGSAAPPGRRDTPRG